MEKEELIERLEKLVQEYRPGRRRAIAQVDEMGLARAVFQATLTREYQNAQSISAILLIFAKAIRKELDGQAS